MNKTLIKIVAGAAVCLSVAGTVWAQTAGGPAPGTTPATPAAGAAHTGGRAALMAQLTPDQQQQVKDKIKELKAAGKTPAEIHAAVAEMLKGWGIQAPGAGGGAGKGIMAQLTPDQRQQVVAKIKELKAAGKTPEEIHAAVAEMLKGWGIQAPAAGGQGAAWKATLEKLTPDQRQQVQAKRQELKAAGKTPAEIHAAIAEMLKGWGVELPAAPAAPAATPAAPAAPNA
ncbi:MAG TPA: hypothetical protein VGM19_09210 [Armatimonadota bacterium]|jgi:uncharacterized protein YoaH (UPF0181 family)